MAARIIFVTGTDTGAGKTVLTALALCHLQTRGLRAGALKPFCSGSWEDTDLLRALHHPPMLRKEVTPWFFKAPVAPLVGAREENRTISLAEVLEEIAHRAEDLEYLLIEGAGGLLAPLGEGFNALRLIQELNAHVLIAARNKLGVINHALLTIRHLESCGIDRWKLALMGDNSDPSSATNLETIRECLKSDSAHLHQIPEFETFTAAHAPNLTASCATILNSLLL